MSWQAIRKYHIETNGWADVGYHAGAELINDRYEILLGRMWTVPGAHCKEQGMNYKSLGLCIVGNFDNQSEVDVLINKGGFDLAVALVRSWCELLHIPPANVKRHYDYAPYKSCPGNKFPWNRFVAAIGG
jgi:N-acetyl-anhydromuramyl-L-alanine amidase AmpD